MHPVEKVKILLEKRLKNDLIRLLSRLSPREIAGIVARVKREEKLEILRNVGLGKRARVLLLMNESDREHLLSDMAEKEISLIISTMASDDACRILRQAGEERADHILSHLPSERRELLRSQLRHSREVAGGMMQREYIAFKATEKAGEALKRIKGTEERLVPPDFYVVDEKGGLIGRITLIRLLKAEREQLISDVMERDPPAIGLLEDREKVIRIFQDRKVHTLPVMEKKRLVGIITLDDALRVLEEEQSEDIFKMFSLEKNEHALDPVIKSLRTRTPWLLINLATAFLAASVVGLFEDVIKSFVLFAVFLPVVAGEGGNATTQTMAVVVRSLALKEITSQELIKVVRKEVTVAFLNGALTGLIAAFFAILWKGSPLIGLALFLAMIINLVVAGLAGALIPLILDRVGSDPASSSTVILTTFTDIFGFLSFLGIGAILIRIFGLS